MTAKRILFLYWFLFFLGIISIHAQQSVVKVIVNDQVGNGYRQFSVVGFDDYISLSPKFFDDTSTVESSAELKFELEAPRWVRVQGPGVNRDIIAVPGSTYYFKIMQDDIATFIERENTGLLINDPNILCDSVNVLINTYLYKYTTQLYSGGMAKQTIRFCDSLEMVFSNSPDALFQTFLGFRLDELLVLSRAWSDHALYTKRFEGKHFQPENPDYAYAFSEFYKGRLAQVLLIKKNEHSLQLINGFKGYDTLTNLLANEKYYPKTEAGEGAFLYGLSELVKNKKYSSDAILYLFNQISDSSDYSSVKLLASRLYKKFKLPVAGDVAPELNVSDKVGSDVTIDSKRATYVCFFDPKSQVTSSELAAIVEMKKTLKDRVVVLPVIINAEKSELAKMQSSLRLNFDLYRNTNISTLSNFRLKSDCTCMVISPTGTYIMPNAPLPSTPLVSEKLLDLAKTVR